MSTVHVVVPDGIDDPARPSGGNVYDRRLCDALASLGVTVHEHAVAGSWPRADAASFAALADVLDRISDDTVVLIDGLIASTAPDVLVPEARRLPIVVLVHMPLGHRPANDDTARTREHAVLSAASAIVTTSGWARRRLLELYGLPGDRIHVAEPGVDAAELAPGTGDGGALLCVAAVIFDKGHDVLLKALATISELSWRCVCVGSLEREPSFVERLRRQAGDLGLGDRVSFPGPRTGAELDRHYADADVLVLASRAETYGMVVTEALARGLPVIAAEVGGLPQALGHGADGSRPGLLVRPDDAAALGATLQNWLEDAELRGRLRRTAGARRTSLPGLVGDGVGRRRGPRRGIAVSAEPPRVSRPWLTLREPADAAARARDLVAILHRASPNTDGSVIHDLGGGTGAMGRWLAPLLRGPQHWVVHDRDADLLEVALVDRPGPAADGAAVTIETRRSDITRVGPGDLARATLVTASALLDMLTEDELTGLVMGCVGAGSPVLLALSVVGRVALSPAEPLDRRVAAAFDAHQRRATPRGRLLGPDAVARAVEAFSRHGSEVLLRSSPWRLGAPDAELMVEWFTGWVAAACQQEVGLAAELGDYARRRLAQAAAGQLAVLVDHADLLALPGVTQAASNRSESA